MLNLSLVEWSFKTLCFSKRLSNALFRNFHEMLSLLLSRQLMIEDSGRVRN